MAVKGLDRLKAQIRSIAPAVKMANELALARAASAMSGAVKRAAPDNKLKASTGWAKAGQTPKTGATGALRTQSSASAMAKGEEGLAVEIYSGDDDAFWARWTEFGTQPHSLAPKADISRGKRQGGGAMHPGARAQPYFFPTIRAQKRGAKLMVARENRKALKGVATGTPGRAAPSGRFDTRGAKG